MLPRLQRETAGRAARTMSVEDDLEAPVGHSWFQGPHSQADGVANGVAALALLLAASVARRRGFWRGPDMLPKVVGQV